MVRVYHGDIISLDRVNEALDIVRNLNVELGIASAQIRISELTPYGYLFPKLQADPNATLQPSKETVKNLVALGMTMNEPDDRPAFDSTIPSAYTYFGQFVDHDITLELQSGRIDLNDENLMPLSLDVIRETIKNSRTPSLDLDCVYGPTSDGTPIPRGCTKLAVGWVTRFRDRPPGKSDFNDLPRKPPSDDPRTDREAIIGDARNDENLILSQLHVAFLRAHGTIAGRGHTFNETRAILSKHYQWIIIHDFLKRIVGQETVNEILTHGNKLYRQTPCNLYMPLEFSAAAYRFGHSMVRSKYDYNINFRNETAAKLEDLFTYAALRSQPEVFFQTLPENLIIDWKSFFVGGSNRARRIDTRLVEPLLRLPEAGIHIGGVKRSLAVRNLLRGYLLRLPTGQKVAEALGITPLSADQLSKVASQVSDEQAKVMRDSGFLQQTPLWYYILAESAFNSNNLLGPVGGTIIAEVLIGLVRNTEDSILRIPDWKPNLGARPGHFDLSDLFRLADAWG